MEYLKDYVSSEVYEKLISLLSLDVQSSLSKNKDNIIKIFKYFKSIGINKFDDLLLFRCDLLFEDVESLKDKINMYLGTEEKVTERDISIFTQNFYLLKKANFNKV